MNRYEYQATVVVFARDRDAADAEAQSLEREIIRRFDGGSASTMTLHEDEPYIEERSSE